MFGVAVVEDLVDEEEGENFDGGFAGGFAGVLPRVLHWVASFIFLKCVDALDDLFCCCWNWRRALMVLPVSLTSRRRMVGSLWWSSVTTEATAICFDEFSFVSLDGT